MAEEFAESPPRAPLERDNDDKIDESEAPLGELSECPLGTDDVICCDCPVDDEEELEEFWGVVMVAKLTNMPRCKLKEVACSWWPSCSSQMT